MHTSIAKILSAIDGTRVMTGAGRAGVIECSRTTPLAGIVDSPVGLAAWMCDHDAASRALIGRVVDGKREGLYRGFAAWKQPGGSSL